MELFYTQQIEDTFALFPEEESYHCVKILRHKQNDIVHFTNGMGSLYEGRITEASSKKCEIAIIREIKKPVGRNYFAHIALAPTKNIDRTEFFIEKAVEIGIDKISFLKCERSERKEVKVERLTKIAVSAMKQSKKATLPVIEHMVSFKEFLKEENHPSNRYIASLTEQDQYSLHQLPKGGNYLILIGPEGDFSPNEVRLAEENGFRSLSLGDNIYRTETAALVACNWLLFFNSFE